MFTSCQTLHFVIVTCWRHPLQGEHRRSSITVHNTSCYCLLNVHIWHGLQRSQCFFPQFTRGSTSFNANSAAYTLLSLRLKITHVSYRILQLASVHNYFPMSKWPTGTASGHTVLTLRVSCSGSLPSLRLARPPFLSLTVMPVSRSYETIRAKRCTLSYQTTKSTSRCDAEVRFAKHLSLNSQFLQSFSVPP